MFSILQNWPFFRVCCQEKYECFFWQPTKLWPEKCWFWGHLNPWIFKFCLELLCRSCVGKCLQKGWEALILGHFWPFHIEFYLGSGTRACQNPPHPPPPPPTREKIFKARAREKEVIFLEQNLKWKWYSWNALTESIRPVSQILRLIQPILISSLYWPGPIL